MNTVVPFACLELVGNILGNAGQVNLILLEYCSTETSQTCRETASILIKLAKPAPKQYTL
jgi:hypothetical protein